MWLLVLLRETMATAVSQQDSRQVAILRKRKKKE
jgi:hypothetical protein